MPMPKLQFCDSSGIPYSGGKLYTAVAGTTPGPSQTSPKATYTDSSGISPNTNPVILDSAGRASIWLDGFYAMLLTDKNGVTVWTADNVSSQGAQTATTGSEWITQSYVYTYLNGNQFSVPGTVTGVFPVNIRVKASVTAGTIYGTVTAVSAGGGPVTTTVTVAWDSGQLDSGLTGASTGILTPVNPSIPPIIFFAGMVIPYAGAAAPSGWLLCAGQSLATANYTALFAVIGYTFGGGGANFTLPDLRGSFPLGADNMGGIAANRVPAANAVGKAGGSANKTIGDHAHANGTLASVSHQHELPIGWRQTNNAITYSTGEVGANTITATGGTQYTHIPNQDTSGNVYIRLISQIAGSANVTGSTANANIANQDVMNPWQSMIYIIKY